MYHHCIYCGSDLGANEAIEEFPVGRRLAFDGDKGRLWVVCGRCERWNLSPMAERWEALEALEKRYRATRTRASTENIGLARLDEGLELVRVGRPRRPEFAAWRYGDQFGRRRKKFIVASTVGVGLAVGLGLGSAALAGASLLYLPVHLYNVGRLAWRKLGPGTRIHTASHGVLEIPHDQIGSPKVRPAADFPEGWVLDLGRSVEGRPLLHGDDAVHALSVILPRLNASGAGRRQVGQAVGLIEEAGSPEAYFRDVEHQARARGRGYGTLMQMPRELRLALEMSAHEEQERAALEGELRQLEDAWREAESIAAIADDLLLPERIRQTLDRLRRTG